LQYSASPFSSASTAGTPKTFDGDFDPDRVGQQRPQQRGVPTTFPTAVPAPRVALGAAAFRNSSHCYSVALHLVECHITAGTTILTSN